jgi:metallo-beta-lactamase family protein
MKIQILGAGKVVTGSCYSLVTKEEKILIDCGMFQGGKDMERLNYEPFSINPKEYDALILTHAHLDHCGRIPKLVKYGFRGKIFATDATRDLAQIILLDAANIAKKDTAYENERRAKENLPARKPIYSEEDVKIAMKLFEIVEYDKDVKITGNIIARFYDAGHILGAASVQIQVKDGREKKLISFSGDLGQSESLIVKNVEPIPKSDYVFIESTYGDRLHPPIADREKDLIRIINETYKRGGKLMIPSFAVERAQEILYSIGLFLEKKLIQKIPVYLDSPMAIRATEVFSLHSEYYNKTIYETLKYQKDPFNFPGLVSTMSTEESKAINFIKKPCIVIAGNGMCSAGRIKHHIRNGIDNEKNTLLFVGYQAQGTLGYWIKKGEKKVKLLGVELPVKAKIESIEGFSAHADYNELIVWLNNFSPKPKKVFITHGEEIQAKAFSKRIEKLGFISYIPALNEEIQL